MKSLSEIETTSKRATRASGYSWGISEEVGKCIRILELFGLPGIKNLNQYYKKKIKKNFQNLNLVGKNNKSKSIFCPIILGVSFLDQVGNIEKFKKCIFVNVAYPLLFLPFLSRSSEIIGKKINLKFNNIEFLLNLNVNIKSNLLNQSIPEVANKVEINFLQNKDNFSEQEWESLYKLSEETFVEENDSLKQNAAGAGLTDND